MIFVEISECTLVLFLAMVIYLLLALWCEFTDRLRRWRNRRKENRK